MVYTQYTYSSYCVAELKAITKLLPIKMQSRNETNLLKAIDVNMYCIYLCLFHEVECLLYNSDFIITNCGI